MFYEELAMISSGLRKIYMQKCKSKHILNILECYKDSKNITRLPYYIAYMSVSEEIPEEIKSWIIYSVLPEYVDNAILPRTIYESAFIGNDYYFGLLFEKGFINEIGICEYLKNTDLIQLLNLINKNFSNNQKVERIINYLVSSLSQVKKQELFEELLRNFKTDKNIFAINFLLNMHEVKIPETINITAVSDHRYFKHLDESDTFAYFANLYKISSDDKEKEIYKELLLLLINSCKVTIGTTLRFTDADGEWCFTSIEDFIAGELKDAIGCDLNHQREGIHDKVYFSVLYFYYYDLLDQINEICEFKYYAIRDVIEFGKRNNVCILNANFDNEKMTIKYSCTKIMDIISLTKKMRDELCNGNYYQILFPSLFLVASNIWASEIYTEENQITEKLLIEFKRNQKRIMYPKKHK